MLYSDLKILFEDNHLIAVYKPANLLTQGDKTGDTSLFELTRQWIKEKYKKPGRVFLGLLHRLDRPVSGIVVFAKTSKAAARVSKQFRERRVEKIYWALVDGRPRFGEQTLSHYWSRKGESGVQIFAEPFPGSKRVELQFTLLREFGDRSLLEVRPHTGRKHQIRGQLAFIGHPIVGDKKYGSRFQNRTGIALMAKRIRFEHPVRREQHVCIEVPDEISLGSVGFSQSARGFCSPARTHK